MGRVPFLMLVASTLWICGAASSTMAERPLYIRAVQRISQALGTRPSSPVLRYIRRQSTWFIISVAGVGARHAREFITAAGGPHKAKQLLTEALLELKDFVRSNEADIRLLVRDAYVSTGRFLEEHSQEIDDFYRLLRSELEQLAAWLQENRNAPLPDILLHLVRRVKEMASVHSETLADLIDNFMSTQVKDFKRRHSARIRKLKRDIKGRADEFDDARGHDVDHLLLTTLRTASFSRCAPCFVATRPALPGKPCAPCLVAHRRRLLQLCLGAKRVPPVLVVPPHVNARGTGDSALPWKKIVAEGACCIVKQNARVPIKCWSPSTIDTSIARQPCAIPQMGSLSIILASLGATTDMRGLCPALASASNST